MSDESEPASGAKPDESSKNKKRLTTGVAVGIGSAAIVAALLYANRSKKTDKDGSR
ncbi:hypothetical protein [Allosphingosinicella sp.]|uniref:hypothetical protein n=1 Tax=Allosphingosinicella sp. TaxID=2823234 RepID=UPI002FC24B77